MRFFVFAFAVIAAASAASIASDYLTPVVDNSLLTQEYIPPTDFSVEPAPLTDEGYLYKVVRKLKLRHRRDVNELLSNEYLPSVGETQQEVVVEAAPEEITVFAAAPIEAASEDSAVLADDGYRYKTVRRIRYRHRRDVNELPTTEYLPSVAAESAPVAEVAAINVDAPAAAATEEKTILADDGYRYKTVRRIRYRYRRDVNELPANEYLPSVGETQQEFVAEAAPEEITFLAAAPIETASEDSAVLADDGYRYKTVRRIRYRHRRDVNELPSNEYLPSVGETQQEVVVEAAPEEITVFAAAPVEAASDDSAVLAADGYRYKTVRRIRYRYRRDVNELPTNEYLPAAAATNEEVVVEAAPEEITVLAAAPVEAASDDSAVLAADGYRYKTVRRIRYRRRRDVNELSANEYLPPVAESEQVAVALAFPEENVVFDAPVVAEAPIEGASQDSAVLAADGYRYKTVRRIRYRHRRDVNELPINKYLPAAAETQEQIIVEAAPEEITVVADAPVEAASDDSAVLAADGYRYKTVRRIRYRRRRDVNELPTNEYLPSGAVEAAPTVEEAAIVVDAPVAAAAEEKTVLADDGYRYKTVRRIRYRYRRDVNELPANEYLPAFQAQTEEIDSVVSVPEEATVLADDGYRYKTVRKLKYRRH